jgi:hypothetical protein
MAELATIVATSEDGIKDPVFKDALPQALAEAGMTEVTWTQFLKSANNSVKYQWGVDTICFFFCNFHNKKIGMNMEKFCEGCDGLLPAGVQVSYLMETQSKSVRASGGNGQGATLFSYHKLIFVK